MRDPDPEPASRLRADRAAPGGGARGMSDLAHILTTVDEWLAGGGRGLAMTDVRRDPPRIARPLPPARGRPRGCGPLGGEARAAGAPRPVAARLRLRDLRSRARGPARAD